MPKYKSVRITISLPPWMDRWLKLWAFVKGTNRATLASNIIQSRIEANRDDIADWLNAIASQEKISRAELEAIVLDEPPVDDVETDDDDIRTKYS